MIEHVVWNSFSCSLENGGGGTPDQNKAHSHQNELSESKSFGGSQHSINSAGTATSSSGIGSLGLLDDPEHTTVLQKQRKELFEEGIKRWFYFQVFHDLLKILASYLTTLLFSLSIQVHLLTEK